jgi:hypothetical protein
MPRGRRAPVEGRLVPPAPSRADFHAHTARSDGLLLPGELAAAAAAAGVRILAIADHDTLLGCRELLAPGAGPLPAGLEVVPAVEINSVARGISELPDGELHVVGLGVDPRDEELEALLARQRGARRRRFARMVERLAEIGMPVHVELEGLVRTDEESLGRPTIARALVAAGFASDVQDAFDRLVGYGRPGYIPREGMGPSDAIRAITAAGGLPVLAHFAAASRLEPVVRELAEAGLAGIEVHHRSFDAATVEAVGAVANRLGLLPSGGTDFHGDEGTYAEAIAETWVPDSVAEALAARLAALPALAPPVAGGPSR